MELLRIVLRAAVVAAPAALIPVGDADIGGAGLVVLGSLALATGWALVDGRRNPARRTWLRWTGVIAVLSLAVVVKSLVQGDPASDIGVSVLLIAAVFGAAAAAGVGLGVATRTTPQPRS